MSCTARSQLKKSLANQEEPRRHPVPMADVRCVDCPCKGLKTYDMTRCGGRFLEKSHIHGLLFSGLATAGFLTV